MTSALLLAIVLAQPANPPTNPTAKDDAPKAQPPAADAPKAQPGAEDKKEDTVKPAAGKPTTTPGGVVVEDLVAGTGDEVKPGTAVVAKYKGMLKDGTVFDETKGEDYATFPLWGVIKGWQEGIPGMKVGGKRKLTIPATMAYGEREIKGEGDKVIIPANSDLIFEVEIVAAMLVEDVVEGKGETARPWATVTMNYRGTFKSDGKEFDSSYNSGKPLNMPLSDLIKGWQFGVPGMKVGCKRKLTIPWQMAYGAAGRGTIPPKADLVFELELLGVQNPPKK